MNINILITSSVGRGGGVRCQIFYFFPPVQQTTSGICHRVIKTTSSFFGLATTATLIEPID